MILITLVTNISGWEKSLPFRSFLNQFIFKACMCSYRSSPKKKTQTQEAAVSWLQLAQGFHWFHSLIYRWTFLKVILFLLLLFIKVDVSSSLKNFICSITNIKQGNKKYYRLGTFDSQPRPPRDITSFLGWKNWVSLSIKCCNLWIGQNIWKQKGMQLDGWNRFNFTSV